MPDTLIDPALLKGKSTNNILRKIFDKPSYLSNPESIYTIYDNSKLEGDQIISGIRAVEEWQVKNVVELIEDEYKKNYDNRMSRVKRFFFSNKKEDYKDFKELVSKLLEALKKLYWCVGAVKIDRILKRVSEGKSSGEEYNEEAELKNIYEAEEALKKAREKFLESKQTIDDMKKQRATLLKELHKGGLLPEKETEKIKEKEELDGKIEEGEGKTPELKRKIRALEKKVSDLWDSHRHNAKAETEKRQKNKKLEINTIKSAHWAFLKTLEDCIDRVNALCKKMDVKSSGGVRNFDNDNPIAIVRLKELKSDFIKQREALMTRQKQISELIGKNNDLIEEIEAEEKKRREEGYQTTVPNDLFSNLESLKSSLKMSEDEELNNKIKELGELVEDCDERNPTLDMALLYKREKEFKDYIKNSQQQHDSTIRATEDHIKRIEAGLKKLDSSKKKENPFAGIRPLMDKKSEATGIIRNKGGEGASPAAKASVVLVKKKREFINDLKGYYIFDNNMGINHKNVKNGKIPEALISKSKYKDYIKVSEAQPCLPIACGNKGLVQQYDHTAAGDKGGIHLGPAYIVIDKNGKMIKEANHKDHRGWFGKNKVNDTFDNEQRAIEEVEQVLKNSYEVGEWRPAGYGDYGVV